jgi:hypothetical protein
VRLQIKCRPYRAQPLFEYNPGRKAWVTPSKRLSPEGTIFYLQPHEIKPITDFV